MSTKKGWVKRRLSHVKQDSPLWADLADAIETLIADHVDVYLDRLKRRVSLFDSNKEDLKVALTELGDFFAFGDVEDEDIALMIMQREDEIHQKRTIYPLTGTLNREFGGLNVTWEPFYAPADQEAYPYGSRFVIESELAQELIPREDWFLTSRGVIRVPLQDVYRVFGYGNEGMAIFEEKIRRIIHPLIPLRIACDGQQYYLHFNLSERLEMLSVVKSHVEQLPLVDAEAQETANVGDNQVNSRLQIIGATGTTPTGEIYVMDETPIDSLDTDYNSRFF